MRQQMAVLSYFRSSLQQILSKLSRIVGTSTFFVASVREDSFRIIEILSADNVAFDQTVWEVLDFLSVGMIGGKQPVVIADTSSNPLAHALFEKGIGSFTSVPIRLSDQTLYGALCTAHPQAYEFSEAEIHSMELVGHVLAYVVELEHAAIKDPLTGAYNRLFLQRHGPGLQEEFGDSFALIYVDLDGFKNVNDQYGHDYGDTVLQLTVQRLKQRVRNGDFVVRVGGDEFVVILTNVANGNSTSIHGAVDRLQGSLGVEYLIEPHRVRVPASLGVSFYPRDGRDFEQLIQTADHAMYRSKSRRLAVAGGADLEKELSSSVPMKRDSVSDDRTWGYEDAARGNGSARKSEFDL